MQNRVDGASGRRACFLLLAALSAGCGGGGGATAGAGSSAPPASTPNLAATTLALVSTTPATAKFGSPLVLTSRVTAASGTSGMPGSAPTGKVDVTLASRTCSITLGQPATASSGGECTLSPAEAGDAVTVSLSYSGDSTYAPTASTFKVRIDKADVSLELTSSPNPSGAGDPIKFSGSALAQPGVEGVPTGTVAFTDPNGKKFCTATLAPAGRAECTLAISDIGVQSVIAEYSGDANFSARTSLSYGHRVSKKCNEPVDPNVIRPPSLCFNTAEYLVAGQSRPLTDFIVFDRGNDPLITWVWLEMHYPTTSGLAITPDAGGIGTDPQGVTYKVHYFTAFGQNVADSCRGLPESIPNRLQAASVSWSQTQPSKFPSVTMPVYMEYQRMNQGGPLCANGQENPYTKSIVDDLFLTLPIQ